MVEPLEDKLFRISEDRSLIVIIDFIPSQVFLILSMLAHVCIFNIAGL